MKDQRKGRRMERVKGEEEVGTKERWTTRRGYGEDNYGSRW